MKSSSVGLAVCDGFVQYLDASNHHRWITSLLTYCDTAGFAMWHHVPTEGLAHVTQAMLDDMCKTASQDVMMRANHVELHTAFGHALREQLLRRPRLRTTARIIAVGRSSYTLQFSIEGGGSLPLATVETVMVNTDDTHTTSAPLAHAGALRELVAAARDAPPRAMSKAKLKFVPPGRGAVCWRHIVRATDCDHYGHVNNALYPLLCEEARAAAAAEAAYSGRAAALARLPAAACSVSYISQARPFEALEITSHLVDDAFHFGVRADAKPVAEVILRVATNGAGSDVTLKARL